MNREMLRALAEMGFAFRQFDCFKTQTGLPMQSVSMQSIAPSESSSLPLLHCSVCGVHAGAHPLCANQLVTLPFCAPLIRPSRFSRVSACAAQLTHSP